MKVTNDGKIGVVSGFLTFDDMEKLGYYDLATIEYSFAAAIPAGFEKSWKTLTDYVKQLKKIFNPNTLCPETLIYGYQRGIQIQLNILYFILFENY